MPVCRSINASPVADVRMVITSISSADFALMSVPDCRSPDNAPFLEGVATRTPVRATITTFEVDP
jgi:hypothetical protein